MRILCSVILCLGLSLNLARAWSSSGNIVCDSNQDGTFDWEDTRLANVRVVVVNLAGTVHASALTDATGYYFIDLPDAPDSYIQTIDPTTLPPGGTVIVPASGQYAFTLTATDRTVGSLRYTVSAPECTPPQDEGACWLTGGGVKFEALTGEHLAEKGPVDSLGGNVFPSCSPEPGNGGSWTHIAHSLKLHFHGTDIQTVSCGNVPGIDPGSESPVTPFNYIEFQGFGTLKGIKGNKVDHGTVYFFARCEDRNEPGSRGAKDGADIDRYFLHVFDANGNTLLLIDGDGNPATLDPVTITGGNLQLHVSSCDDPPAP
jgi:hypothetical protein